MFRAALVSLLLTACTVDYSFHSPSEKIWPDSIPGEVNFERIQEDIISEEAHNPVDILFVIDYSCSMSNDRLNMNRNIPIFFEILEEWNISYQVGIISTDSDYGMGELNNLSFITPRTEDPPIMFSNMNTASTFEVGEEGIKTIYQSMNRSLDVNRNFFRKGVPLHIVIISDEDDSSEFSPKELYHFLTNRAQLRKNANISLSSVVQLHPEDSGCKISSMYTGYKYIQLTNRMGGELIDICTADWRDALERIATYAVDETAQEFFLTDIPIVETIQVQILRQGATIVLDSYEWEYNETRNSITLLEFELIEEDSFKAIYSVKR